MLHCLWVVRLWCVVAIAGWGAVIKTLCPSGLRGWTQVPLARAAWVQIPQVSLSCRSLCVVGGLGHASGTCIWEPRSQWHSQWGARHLWDSNPPGGTPSGLASRRFNHSAKVPLRTVGRLRFLCRCFCGWRRGCRCMAGGSCCDGLWSLTIGYIAQWLERLTADQQVPGSNPCVLCFSASLFLQCGLAFQISGHPGSNQGSSDCCRHLLSDSLPTEL